MGKNKSIPHRPDCDRHHRRPTFDSHQHIIDTTISRPIAAKIPPGANENTSNDDDESAKNMLTGPSSASATTGSNAVMVKNDYYCSTFYGSDDESTIESDQPLFLDAVPASSNRSSTPDTHAGTHTGSDADANEDNTVIAEFLEGVFVVESDAPSPSTALPDVDLGLTAADMEAFLLDGDSNAMMLPDPCA